VAHYAGADQSGAADGGVQAPARCAVAHGESGDVVVFHIFHASSIAYALGQKLSNPKKVKLFFGVRLAQFLYCIFRKSLIMKDLRLRRGALCVSR